MIFHVVIVGESFFFSLFVLTVKPCGFTYIFMWIKLFMFYAPPLPFFDGPIPNPFCQPLSVIFLMIVITLQGVQRFEYLVMHPDLSGF